MMSDQHSQQPQRMNNAQTSRAQVLEGVLASLKSREPELTAVLPPDIAFQAFHATINQALRNNPKLLDCVPDSIIRACVKAAYDGLRVDGREAAMVDEEITVKAGRGQPERKVRQVRYMPMYQGLVQQVLRGGMVIACEADVIYEKDEHEILRGTSGGIYHKPYLLGPRGRPIAVYNVATLPSGYKASAFMTAEEVREVQKMSKSGWDSREGKSKGVWARWEGEQWKKTVLRRHRKVLPVPRDIVIRDMEAQSEFPALAPAAAAPALPARPRPTRDALAHQPSIDQPLDFGQRDDREYETIDAETGEVEQTRERAQVAEKGVDSTDEPILPADDGEWAVWLNEVEEQIAECGDIAALMQIQEQIAPIEQHADGTLRGRVTKAFTDRAADIAAGPDDGAAAGGRAQGTAAEDR
jgi:recombination protein RecT